LVQFWLSAKKIAFNVKTYLPLCRESKYVPMNTIKNSLPQLSGKDNNFLLIAGPCVIESRDITFETAEKLKEITSALELPFVFKSSYRKANRSRLDSFSGIGDIEGLKILAEVRDKLQVPVITDIHSAEEAAMAAPYVDILQIPAFLCRQTDILIAAAKTGKIVNIKKGQFLAPEAMQFAIKKVTDSGNRNIMLTDRGTMFGYYDLIVDYRSIKIMQEYGYPVILDITHSLQQPNTSSGVTGGKPELIETIARAGIAIGVDGIFMETHPNPSAAKSDGANMLPLGEVNRLLTLLLKIQRAIRE